MAAKTEKTEQAPAQDPVVEQPAVEQSPDPTVETTSAPVAEAPPAPEPAPAPEPVVIQSLDPPVEAPVAQEKKESSFLLYVKSQLNVYATTLAVGKPVSGDLGAKMQYMLYKLQLTIAGNESYDEFLKGWTALLSAYKEHEAGVFNPSYVNRFMPDWVYSKNEMLLFNMFNDLLVLTADPRQRKVAMKQIDLPRFLQQPGITEQIVRNLSRFYS